MVGIKVLDGITYYGQAYSGKYKYIVTPAKVSGLAAFTNGDQVTLTWNGIRNATSYSVYKNSKKTGTYTLLKSGLTTTTCVLDSVDNNCTTYYKVEATAKLGSASKKGPMSSPVETKIPLMSGTPSELTFYLNMDEEFCLKWKAGNHADGYKVLYKDLTAGGGYKALVTTETVKVSLKSLQASHKYSIKVQSYRLVNKKKVFSDYYSEEFTLVPKTYIKEHEQELLAANVRTIEYIGTTKCVYTTNHYSDKAKTAFVNYKGYSSTTDYLIWISHYTQQTIIFKGSKGKWKIDRSCNCSTGTAATRSPIGVFKITYKEDGWFYTYTKELYVTHWNGRNSFHTRPLNNDGSVNDPTIGKPASHGCSRLLNKDAMYIWKSIPIGTTVVSY